MSRITYGRADVNALYRSFHGQIHEDWKKRQQEKASGHEVKEVIPSSLVALIFPCGWNADGLPVLWEAETVQDFTPGQKLNVRAKDEKGLIRELRWRVAEWLRTSQKLEASEARSKARTWPVFIADRLPRRPSKGEILASDGSTLTGE